MNYSFDSSRGELHVPIPGDVLSTNVDQLRSELASVLEANDKKSWKVLELDFARTKMIDSTGLNFVVSLVRTAQAKGGRVRAVVPNPNLRRMFLFTRLDRHLDLVGDGARE